MMRFRIERYRGMGMVVFRLPLRVGISVHSPWRGLMFGVGLNDIGIEWAVGPFSGEIWRDRDILQTPRQWPGFGD